MKLHSYYKQLRTVIFIELILIGLGILFAVKFWNSVCDGAGLSCLAEEPSSLSTFYLLSFIRPFLLTPLSFLSLIAGNTFGFSWGTLNSAAGATLSCVIIYFLAKTFGKRLAHPWLSSNLPQTLNFIRSQDWKIGRAHV